MKSSRQLLVYLGVIALSVGFWLLLGLSGILKGIEQESIRWRYLVRGEIESTAPIVYVDLDEATVSYMGDRPWDRREFGVLLRALLGPGQAKVVSVDIILSKTGGGSLLDWERARQGDEFLGTAVEAYAERVILAAAYTGILSNTMNEPMKFPWIREGDDDPEAAPFPEAPTFPIIKENIGRLGLADVDEGLGRGLVPYFVPGFVELHSARYSYHLMDGLARHRSHYMNEPRPVADGELVHLTDKDGWTTYTMPRVHEMTLFSLGLETFLAAHELSQEDVKITSEELIISLDEAIFRRVPLVEQQSIEVNWFQGWRPPYDSDRYSMQEVLRKADALGDASVAGDTAQVAELEQWFLSFKDKVIFVGPVDPQLKDISPTPYNTEPVPRVGLHANLYRTLEGEAYMTRTDSGMSAVIVCLLTALVALSALGNRAQRSCALILLVGYCAFTFWVFAQLNWILPFVVPIGSTFTAALVIVLLKLGSEEWQRRRIKALFGAYVSPKLVDEMVDSKQDPKLGGTEAQITALFSDVEGFSALSEDLSPDQLVSLMNEYLGAMTEVFQMQSGTLDKYIGDAIVTMFGMPLPVVDHAARACRSAVEMQERHAALRVKWAQMGKWPDSVINMRTRIGLNTGLAVIGNMGSEMRFNYTMMGDTVNLAARCESGAKSYGVYTMVTEATLNAALADGVELNYRKVDRIVVKGRRQPVDLYELWEPSIPLSTSAVCKTAYESALELYFQGNWAAALEGFQAAESHEPAKAYAHTTPSAVLAARCRLYIKEGAPEDWDGAFKMQTK